MKMIMAILAVTVVLGAAGVASAESGVAKMEPAFAPASGKVTGITPSKTDDDMAEMSAQAKQEELLGNISKSISQLSQQMKVTECVSRTSAIRNALYHCLTRCGNTTGVCASTCYDKYDTNNSTYVPEECRAFAPPL